MTWQRAAEAYRNRLVRGRRGLIPASVVCGCVGVIGYHFIGGSGSGEPVVIQPTISRSRCSRKIRRCNGSEPDKAVYDRVAGTLPNNWNKAADHVRRRARRASGNG